MCLKLCKTKRVKIKDGRTITIRRPKMSDAKQLREYVNSLVDEDALIKISGAQKSRASRYFPGISRRTSNTYMTRLLLTALFGIWKNIATWKTCMT